MVRACPEVVHNEARVVDTIAISNQFARGGRTRNQARKGAGGAFNGVMSGLAVARVHTAARAIGLSRGSLEDSLAYAQEREQFGKPISHHQAIAFKLADMATELDAARLLVQRAAWLRDQGETATKECSMAKLYASRACNQAAQEAVQIHGGAGYTKEFPVERFYRDARITEIYEGATDVQRIVISRRLFQG